MLYSHCQRITSPSLNSRRRSDFFSPLLPQQIRYFPTAHLCLFFPPCVIILTDSSLLCWKGRAGFGEISFPWLWEFLQTEVLTVTWKQSSRTTVALVLDWMPINPNLFIPLKQRLARVCQFVRRGKWIVWSGGLWARGSCITTGRFH